MLNHDERNTIALAAMLLEELSSIPGHGADCREAVARLRALVEQPAPPPHDAWEARALDVLAGALDEATREDGYVQAHPKLCELAGELAFEGRALSRDYVAYRLRGLAAEMGD